MKVTKKAMSNMGVFTKLLGKLGGLTYARGTICARVLHPLVALSLMVYCIIGAPLSAFNGHNSLGDVYRGTFREVAWW